MTDMTKHTSIEEMIEKVEYLIAEMAAKFPHIPLEDFREKVLISLRSREISLEDDVYNILILSAVERISMNEPDWTYIASSVFIRRLYRQVARARGYDEEEKYGSFYQLISTLTKLGIYSESLLEKYSLQEISYLQSVLNPDKDQLFSYIGIVTLADRYLAKTHDGQLYELPQERFMVIAMTLMKNEPKEQRLTLVEEAYWALSNLYMTVATPTLANAGKGYGQLSSCFIDTVEDDLRSIYDSNTDISTLSKNGGGIGVYLGKIRSRGSDIKGFKGVSSGVIPWMKQLNNTAVSVDQLGQRQGAIAVYLDVWHKDIFAFLDTRLNNGDERQRTHDLFTGVCIPDLFMKHVEQREDWYLFDPHEVRRVLGYSLEDFYDEEENGEFTQRYWKCVHHPLLSKKRVPAIEIFKSIMISQLETGTPYMFYRDTVNRENPNKHKGIIYCSNLCTEITQNMSPTVMEEEKVVDGKIVTYKIPGDFVVCNLSSISLARSVRDNVLERLISIQVRMLDNVIDINTIPVLQAQITNQKYRSIGLGTFGWHHLLALQGIKWESEEAVEYCDRLYEEIAYYTIRASVKLAKEKGKYPHFEGSEWQNGRYFNRKGYISPKWQELKNEVQEHGIRNGYLMAIAPNSTTSIIAGSTASIDPIFRKEYSEEKKNYKIPVTAPDLSAKTTWYYKNAYEIDQHWSIQQNAKRQRHIDQAISFNFYVTHDIKASALLILHMDAWKSGLKTTYYVRSTSSSFIEECESCES
ncbi:ribonucleoside-diphosphate reductase alpha chain [Oikeobacillus pervagus]|uniref:Ribonucleoside-diphosphate reductase n=1 Tax=Oikeobacillus pervagus TaxID=1325931 RepID=A0AAJ1T067_9BACI|nr:ribonucleoside-diphosphate reductase alpha chain [Oikeobacillus pervagus]